MLKNGKMPTPWRHPKHGTYYLKKRVPQAIKHLWTGTDPVQISLHTKNESEAHNRICAAWLDLSRKFESLERQALRQAPLSEAIIPHLLEEWLHDSLAHDEQQRIIGLIPRAPGKANPGYAELRDSLIDGYQTGQHPEFLVREAAWLLSQKGIAFDPKSYSFAKLVDHLSPLYCRYLNTLAARDEGQRTPTPARPKPVLLVSQLYEKFKAHRTGENSWKDPETQDKREYGPLVREFISVVGDKPVHTLTLEDTQKYYEHTIAREDIRLGTKKRNLTRIKTLLLYARKRHQAPDITEPLQIQTTYAKTHSSYERFTKPELKALFESPAYKEGTFKKASLFWLPIIGLYTGARIDEIASLLVSEIEQKDGVWCYFMSSKEANAGGKNEFAPRWVPIHPAVLAAGFIPFWQTVKGEGHKRLFPELGNAARDGCSKRATVDFTEYRRSVGVGALKERSTKTFHSFRSTLVSELKERGIDGDTRRALVGHARGKGDVHETIYDQSDFQPRKAFDALSVADFGLKHTRFEDTEAMKTARSRHRPHN